MASNLGFQTRERELPTRACLSGGGAEKLPLADPNFPASGFGDLVELRLPASS